MKPSKSRGNGSIVVMKFGGTSVENAAAIQRVAEIVESRKGAGRVVVVSALAKVTDHHVGRLQVPVDDAFAVRQVDGPGQGLDERGRLARRRR